jgi:Uma2 family endonuclease
VASVAQKLTWEEFERQYGPSEKRFEYWSGEAIPRSIPTWLHGLLQAIIVSLLQQAGYRAGAEVELRIGEEARPRPDVIATRGKVELPYPTRAVEIVVEILSENDHMSHVLNKCRAYQRWGFHHI